MLRTEAVLQQCLCAALGLSTHSLIAKSCQSCPTLCKPTRLRCPWDSPGKNTGVGCHFLLQCMKVKRESEVAQSCPTLRDPMDCSPPGSSVHGIFQARVLEWGSLKSPFSHLFSHPVECSRSQIFWVCLLASLWRHLACSFDLSPTSGS